MLDVEVIGGSKLPEEALCRLVAIALVKALIHDDFVSREVAPQALTEFVGTAAHDGHATWTAIEVFQQFPHGPRRRGVDGVGRDLRKLGEDEPAGPKTGMRQAQLGRVDDPIAVEEQIEVKRPFAPADGPLPALGMLDLMKAF